MHRLAQLTPAELADLVRAQWALLASRLRLRTLPSGELIRLSAAASSAPANVGELARARALGLAVDRVAEHGIFRPTCLVRAAAIQRLLRRDGIGAGSIRVGVRRDAGRFAAHAWVEIGDLVLGDEAPHVRLFTPVDDITLVSL